MMDYRFMWMWLLIHALKSIKGPIRRQAITQTNVDEVLHCHMVLGHKCCCIWIRITSFPKPFDVQQELWYIVLDLLQKGIDPTQLKDIWRTCHASTNPIQLPISDFHQFVDHDQPSKHSIIFKWARIKLMLTALTQSLTQWSWPNPMELTQSGPSSGTLWHLYRVVYTQFLLLLKTAYTTQPPAGCWKVIHLPMFNWLADIRHIWTQGWF